MLSLIRHNTTSRFLVFIIITFSSGYALAFGNFSDTIPLSSVYTGYRIELVDFKLINKSDDKISATVTVINSGKFPVGLGSFGFKTAKLKVLFDTELDQVSKDAIITKVINTSLSLEPGDISKNIQIDADLLHYKSEWKTKSDNMNQETAQKQVTKITAPEEKKTIDAVKNNVNNTANSTLAATSTLQSSTDEKCPDLIISKVNFLKKSKSKLLIEYTLTNQGTDAAQLYDKKAKEKEYVIITAYFSASGKLSRGSVEAGGDAIVKGLESTGGKLLPGSSLTNKISIDISSKSRFLNTLILSADSRQVIYECVENNNNASILIE